MAEENEQNNADSEGMIKRSASYLKSGVNTVFSWVDKEVKNFADLDPRGVGMKAKGNYGDYHMMIEVPTPAWFPDSFLRSLKRNLYYNMINCGSFYGHNSIKQSNSAGSGKCLDFYQEQSGNPLVNLATTAVRSIVSTAANQVMSVTSKVDSVVNGVSSLFGGSGGGNTNLLRMIRETAENPFLASQPFLKINGIHIAYGVRDKWLALKDTGKTISTTWQSMLGELAKGSNMDLTGLFDKYNQELKQGLINMQILPSDCANMSLVDALGTLLIEPRKRMHNFAEKQLLSSVSGYYTLTCKLPYFGNKRPMLQSSGTRAWRTGWGEDSHNEENSAILQVLKRFGLNNATWSTPIEWSVSRLGRDSILPVEYTFNIYNDTLEHVVTNLAFIWSFGATTMATTDYIMIKPPYIYDIEVPGGIRFRYCSCGFEVVPQGKMRRITSFKVIDSEANGDKLCKMLADFCGIEVNPDALTYVPDYYKITVSFKSLLPNTWNFVDSYLHDGNTKPVTGRELRSLIADIIGGFAGSTGQ